MLNQETKWESGDGELETVEGSAEIENRESKIENSSGISLGLRASG
jgi:hypothetical protein